MPRYLVERTFCEGATLPPPGRQRQRFLSNNARDGVTWVYSFVAPDKGKSFCIYDAPSPQALRLAAQRNGLPVDRITEVHLIDPYG